jgi:hypothetical protein
VKAAGGFKGVFMVCRRVKRLGKLAGKLGGSLRGFVMADGRIAMKLISWVVVGMGNVKEKWGKNLPDVTTMAGELDDANTYHTDV